MSCGNLLWSLCIKSVLDNDALFNKLDSNLADGRPLRSFYVSQILLTPSTWTIIRSGTWPIWGFNRFFGFEKLDFVPILMIMTIFVPYVMKFLLDARKIRDFDREKVTFLGSKTPCRRSQGAEHCNSWLCRPEFHPNRTFFIIFSKFFRPRKPCEK